MTASDDNTARIWDAYGRPLQELKVTLTVSQTRSSALTESLLQPPVATVPHACGTLPLGGPLQEMKDHTDQVNSAVFSPDGKSLVTGSDDKTARIWNCEELGDLQSLLELAKKRVPRKLTTEERRIYLNQ